MLGISPHTSTSWQDRYDTAMAPFSANYTVLAKADSPIAGLEIEIRHFAWHSSPPPTSVSIDLNYLSLAITPRPAKMQVD